MQAIKIWDPYNFIYFVQLDISYSASEQVHVSRGVTMIIFC